MSQHRLWKCVALSLFLFPSVGDLCFVCLCLLSVNVKTVGDSDNILISVPKAEEVKGQLGFHSSTLTNPSVVVFVAAVFQIVKSKSISKLQTFQSLIHFAILSMLIN